jgi:hypothetical protein
MASEVGVSTSPAQGGRKGTAPAGPDVPHRHRAGTHRPRRRDQARLAAARPYSEWLDASRSTSPTCPKRSVDRTDDSNSDPPADLRLHPRGAPLLVAPMALTGKEAIGSMGTDTPSPCCRVAPACSTTTSSSCSPRSPTRRSTRSARRSSPRLCARLGPERNLSTRRRVVPATSSSSTRSHRHRQREADRPRCEPDGSRTSSSPWSSHPVPRRRRRQQGCALRSTTSATWRARVIDEGATIIVLSDRGATSQLAPIPALLAPRPCITTWCVRSPGRRSASWSRPARCARCTTSACCSATAPTRSTPTWCSRASIT